MFAVEGNPVPAVTAKEMREVDRVATEDVGLHLLSMMENAGRAVAGTVREHAETEGPVTVLAGGGGNGGGGLVAARHLNNSNRTVRVVLDRPPNELSGVPARQLRVLRATDVAVSTTSPPPEGIAIDAVIGYGLRKAARGRAAELIERANEFRTLVSLDVPSGVDATSGDDPGPAVIPDRTVTLALPKTGLAGVSTGDLELADIGIPPSVFERAGISYEDPFGGRERVPVTVENGI